MSETPLLTEKESADYQRRSSRTLARERSEGRGCPYVKIGSTIFYRKADLDRFIEAHLTGGEDREQRAAAVEGRKPTPPRGLRGRRKPSDSDSHVPA